MDLQGLVGEVNSNDGPNPFFRKGRQNDAITSNLHGLYFEGAYRKRRFGGSMQAVLATASIAGLNASITGVSALFNPPNNTYNVVVEMVGLGFVLAPAAPLAFGLATGISGTPLAGTLTSLAPKSKFLGGPAPTAGLVASAAITLPVAPTVDTVLGVLDQGAVTTVTGVSQLYDLQGSIILPPGGFACLWTSAVLAASAHIMSWQWEETPV